MHGCNINCTAWSLGVDYPNYEPDPDIAGIGIVTVFAFSAFINLCLYVAWVVLGATPARDENSIDRWVFKTFSRLTRSHIRSEQKEFWIPIIERVALTISDQQLLTGLAVLIAGFWTHCTISVYHFGMVNDLAWFSANAHLISLSILIPYMRQRQHQVARNWRVMLIVFMAGLLVASCIMRGHYAWDDSQSYHAQCLFDDLRGNISGVPGSWVFLDLFWIAMSYPSSIIHLYEIPPALFPYRLTTKPKRSVREQIRKIKAARSVSTGARPIRNALQLAVLLPIQVICHINLELYESYIVDLCQNTLWFSYGMYGIIEDRAIPSSSMAGSENEMSFGQIVPIFLLSSTIFVFKEAYDEQMNVISKKDTPQDHTSQTNLVNSERSSAAFSIEGRYEMSGALSYPDDEQEHLPGSCRRADTEAGGRLQITGHEAGHPLQIALRRSTFPRS